MGEIEYDQNYASWLTAAGLTPNSTPINLRGVVHQILQNLGNSSNSPALSALGYQQLGGAHSQKLQGWFAALANRNFTRCNVVCIGDSVTEGMGATSESYRWTERLRQTINSRFPCITQPVGGRGFLEPYLTSGLTSFSASYVTVTGTAPTPYVGSTNTPAYGPNNKAYDISPGTIFTYSLVGDSADILWVQVPSGGTFGWKVDSGSVTNVSTAGATLQDGKVTHISLGSAGSHTLQITHVSGSTTVVSGIVEYDGDYASGVQVHNCGYFGSSTNWWASPADPAGTEAWPAAVNSLVPSLITIEIGAADFDSSISTATIQTNISTMITDIRAALTTSCPILLIPIYPAFGLDSTWQQLVNVYYAIAASDPLIDVFDLSLRMPATDATQQWGLFYSDATHPSNKGQQYIADAMADFLSPA